MTRDRCAVRLCAPIVPQYWFSCCAIHMHTNLALLGRNVTDGSDRNETPGGEETHASLAALLLVRPRGQLAPLLYI